MIDVPLLIGGGILGLLVKQTKTTVRATVEHFLMIYLSLFFATFLFLDLPARIGLELPTHTFSPDSPPGNLMWLLSISLFSGFIITALAKVILKKHFTFDSQSGK